MPVCFDTSPHVASQPDMIYHSFTSDSSRKSAFLWTLCLPTLLRNRAPCACCWPARIGRCGARARGLSRACLLWQAAALRQRQLPSRQPTHAYAGLPAAGSRETALSLTIFFYLFINSRFVFVNFSIGSNPPFAFPHRPCTRRLRLLKIRGPSRTCGLEWRNSLFAIFAGRNRPPGFPLGHSLAGAYACISVEASNSPLESPVVKPFDS